MKKIKYIKGNQEHSREIEKYFVSQGAEHTGRSTYALETFAYFVNPDTGCVDGYSVDSWEFKAFVKSGVFEELKYPYTESKPKLKVIQGDPCRGDEVIGLLMSMGGKNTIPVFGRSLQDYYYINNFGCIETHIKNHKFFDDYEIEIMTLPEKVAPKPKLQVIQGDPDRGDEVIKLLKGLGGINSYNAFGDDPDTYYYIDEDKRINTAWDIKYFKNYEIEILTLPKKFVPFVSKVLVRSNPGSWWMPAFFFSEESEGGARWYHIVGTYDTYRECIPYEGNEELAFTFNDVRSM